MLYQKILLPIDINDENSWNKTLPQALTIAENNPGAQLWVLFVVPNFGFSIVEEYFPKGWMKNITTKSMDTMEKIVKNHNSFAVTPNLVVSKGVVYQTILDYAAKLEIDLIIMSASHPNNKEYLLGPNVAKVARHANVSVLISR